MLDALANWLTLANTPVRWVTFALLLANLAWTLPIAVLVAIGRPTRSWPNAQFTIPLSGLLLCFIGFQTGYLFEDVPQIPHWRKTVNLLLGAIALISFLIMYRQRASDAERLFGETAWPLKFWRWLRGKARP